MKSALARDRLLAIASWRFGWSGWSGWIAALAGPQPAHAPEGLATLPRGFCFRRRPCPLEYADLDIISFPPDS